MDDLVVLLPGGEVTPLLDHLETAAFVNIRPGVDAEEDRPQTPLGNLFAARGPAVPLATWTPGEIGLQHRAGGQVVRHLATQGVAVPDEWYVVSDHPRSGLVVRTYATPPVDVLRWLVRAVEATCPFEITDDWQATVRRR